jgi:hypothetical protein
MLWGLNRVKILRQPTCRTQYRFLALNHCASSPSCPSTHCSSPSRLPSVVRLEQCSQHSPRLSAIGFTLIQRCDLLSSFGVLITCVLKPVSCLDITQAAGHQHVQIRKYLAKLRGFVCPVDRIKSDFTISKLALTRHFLSFSAFRRV